MQASARDKSVVPWPSIGCRRTPMQRKSHSIDTGGDQLMQAKMRKGIGGTWPYHGLGATPCSRLWHSRGAEDELGCSGDFKNRARIPLHRRVRMERGASLISLHRWSGKWVVNPFTLAGIGKNLKNFQWFQWHQRCAIYDCHWNHCVQKGEYQIQSMYFHGAPTFLV